MRSFIVNSIIFIYSISPVIAAVNIEKKGEVNTVSYQHILNWSLGLVMVLLLFFLCVWLTKKTGLLPVSSKERMSVVAGLSLGVREKLVLVQVGNKQLLLGVTPGKIENLLLLEGDDLLQKEPETENTNEFSSKLKQVMTGLGK